VSRKLGENDKKTLQLLLKKCNDTVKVLELLLLILAVLSRVFCADLKLHLLPVVLWHI